MTFGRIRSEAKFRSASAPASSSAAFAFGVFFFSMSQSGRGEQKFASCGLLLDTETTMDGVGFIWIQMG